MSFHKDFLKGRMQDLVGYNNADVFKDGQLALEKTVLDTFETLVRTTDAVGDKSCAPYIVNALGVMNEGDKVKACEILADRAHSMMNNVTGEFGLWQLQQARKIKELAFKTMFVHSFFPNADDWTRDSLVDMQQTSAGKEYVDYAVTLLAQVRHIPVAYQKQRYGIK